MTSLVFSFAALIAELILPVTSIIMRMSAPVPSGASLPPTLTQLPPPAEADQSEEASKHEMIVQTSAITDVRWRMATRGERRMSGRVQGWVNEDGTTLGKHAQGKEERKS